MDIEYADTWKNDYLSLINHLINSVETRSDFAEWWRLRKESIIKGKIRIMVALKNGNPVGFLTYLFDDNIGKLEAVHVLDVPEKQEIAVTLLERAIELLKQRKDLADISGELYYIAGPIDILADCIDDAGGTVYIRVGMARDLKGAPPNPVLPEGYSVYEWSKEDIPLLAEVFCEAFKDSIDIVFWEHFRNPDKAKIYIENVFNSEVWSHIPMTNICVAHDGNICGANLCGVPEKNKGAIYMGVLPEHREKGLGRFLLTQALTGYHDAQFETVGLEVTLQNEVAYPFFKRYGFEDIYRLIGYTFASECNK
ncbi:MAG: GNAT family N-acetyltransferase [Candidatus Methanofastidiosia archaeon]|jgi:ribosomal protein S18 acetylase RimI-like enzyme